MKKLFLIFLLLPCMVDAISLSAFRIYLDDKTGNQTFTVFNKENVAQDCELGLRHFEFDYYGKMSENRAEATPAYSANPYIRFSPKRFKVSPFSSQTVKFKRKRARLDSSAEFLSYLSVKCRGNAVAKTSGANTGISITPQLMHNLPIVVRYGKFDDLNLSFDIKSADNGVVKAAVLRKGKRSVFGDIELFDVETNDTIASRKNVSIYSPTEHYKFQLNTKNIALRKLALRFVEANVTILQRKLPL